MAVMIVLPIELNCRTNISYECLHIKNQSCKLNLQQLIICENYYFISNFIEMPDKLSYFLVKYAKNTRKKVQISCRFNYLHYICLCNIILPNLLLTKFMSL